MILTEIFRYIGACFARLNDQGLTSSILFTSRMFPPLDFEGSVGVFNMYRWILVCLFIPASHVSAQIDKQYVTPILSQYTQEDLVARLGCTHCKGSYNFTQKDYLNEGADEILGTGMRVIKIWLQGPQGNYPYNSDYPRYDNLVKTAEHPHFRKFFNKPFHTFIINCFSHHGGDNEYYRNGVSDIQYEHEVEEFYELAKYLLTTYRGTGKTFVLQHWEGDWAIRPVDDRRPIKDPTPTAIQGMIRWLNARQEGVNRARNEIKDTDVKVYHACEVNLVEMAIEGEHSVTNDVLPYTHCDLYSYSAYDTIHYARTNPPKARPAFRAALDYLASKAPDSEAFGNKNIYIGEFGQPCVLSVQDHSASEEKAFAVIRLAVEESLRWGCPYIVYWQVYDNEVRVRHRRPRNDEVRGFYLIRPDGTPCYAWHYFRALLQPTCSAAR